MTLRSGNEASKSGNEASRSGNEASRSGNEASRSGNEASKSGNVASKSGNEAIVELINYLCPINDKHVKWHIPHPLRGDCSSPRTSRQ